MVRSLAMGVTLAMAGTALAGGTGNDADVTISTASERGSTPGGNQYFVGETTVSMLFSPDGPRSFSGAYVVFEPGARTAWHTHPAGQTLVVTEGSGWVQVEGEARRNIKSGDVVWIPAGARHWHGATSSSAMTHMALQGDVRGTAVNWLELVTDEQYLGQKTNEATPVDGVAIKD